MRKGRHSCGGPRPEPVGVVGEGRLKCNIRVNEYDSNGLAFAPLVVGQMDKLKTTKGNSTKMKYETYKTRRLLVAIFMLLSVAVLTLSSPLPVCAAGGACDPGGTYYDACEGVGLTTYDTCRAAGGSKEQCDAAAKESQNNCLRETLGVQSLTDLHSTRGGTAL